MTSAVREVKTESHDRYGTLTYPIQGIQIDPVRLRADLDNVLQNETLWKRQNKYKNVGWKGVALYSRTGEPEDLAQTLLLPVHKTKVGSLCPYICDEILPQFGAPWLRVAFYKLEAGAQIGEHRDIVQNQGGRGMARIHVPVITNDKVIMYVGHKPYHYPPGSAWYFDPTAQHAVENLGNEDRIHLLVDFKCTPEFNRLLKPLDLRDRARFAYITTLYYALRLFAFLRLKPKVRTER
jgi:Aspartyl/Asparaginyl beta-hydroxylase